MAGGDPRMADGAERLDELIRSFASGGLRLTASSTTMAATVVMVTMGPACGCSITGGIESRS
jgi:hypothetical protein